MEKKNYFNVFNVFFMLMLVLFGCESVSYDDTSTPKNNNEKKKCVITFNANGGIGEMDALIAEEGKNIELTENAFIKEGYDFIGWARDEKSNEANYFDKDAIEVKESMQLYAIWKIKEITITFNANGESVNIPEPIKENAGLIKLPAMNGKFLYWSTTKDAKSGTHYLDSGYFYNDTLLYVIYLKDNEHKITYYLNDDKSATKISSYVEGKECKLEEPTRDGYIFIGWYKDKSCLGSKIVSIEIGENTDVAFYAKWKKSPDKTISKIEVNKPKSRISYSVGCKSVDLCIYLSVTKTNNSEINVKVTPDMVVNSFDSSTIGTKSLAIEYCGWETTFDIKILNITAANVVNIIKELPNNDDVHEICVTGEISIDTLEQIGKTLSENNNIAKIYLDLSKTTKPESIGDFVIDNFVFSKCTNLIGITLSADVTGISNDAFAGCTNLTSLRVTENNKNYKSFENCVYSKDGKALEAAACGLTNLTMLDGVEEISNNGLAHCSKLTTVTMPDSLTTIGDCAFAQCDSLTSVAISKNVKSIEPFAFMDCANLTSFVVDENNETYKSFGNCIYSKDGKTLVVAAYGLRSITIPSDVTEIGKAAFFTEGNLEVINYKGTEEQWKKISIKGSNDVLKKLKINFNSK